MIVAPRPGDGVLGCGGLICAALERGVALRVVALTAGEGSHPGSTDYPPRALGTVREHEQFAALRALGWKAPEIHRLRVPDGGIVAAPSQTRERVRELLKGSSGVFVTAPGTDAEHGAAAALVDAHASAAPVFQYSVEPSSSREGRIELDIGMWRVLKRVAISCHQTQLGEIVRDVETRRRFSEAVMERALGGLETFWRVDRD